MSVRILTGDLCPHARLRGTYCYCPRTIIQGTDQKKTQRFESGAGTKNMFLDVAPYFQHSHFPGEQCHCYLNDNKHRAIHLTILFGSVPVDTKAYRNVSIRSSDPHLKISHQMRVIDQQEPSNLVDSRCFKILQTCTKTGASGIHIIPLQFRVVFAPKTPSLMYYKRFTIVLGQFYIIVTCKGFSEAPALCFDRNVINFPGVYFGDKVQAHLDLINLSAAPTWYNLDSDNERSVFKFNPNKGYVKGKTRQRIQVTFDPLACQTYYKRVYCLAHHQAPQFVDLVGICVTRPFFEESCEKYCICLDHTAFPSLPLDPFNDYFIEGTNWGLKLSSQEIDFGGVTKAVKSSDTTCQRSVTLKNDLPYTICISWTQDPTGVFVICPGKITAPSGESKEFTVTFNPTIQNTVFHGQLECFIHPENDNWPDDPGSPWECCPLIHESKNFCPVQLTVLYDINGQTILEEINDIEVNSAQTEEFETEEIEDESEWSPLTTAETETTITTTAITPEPESKPRSHKKKLKGTRSRKNLASTASTDGKVKSVDSKKHLRSVKPGEEQENVLETSSASILVRNSEISLKHPEVTLSGIDELVKAALVDDSNMSKKSSESNSNTSLNPACPDQDNSLMTREKAACFARLQGIQNSCALKKPKKSVVAIPLCLKLNVCGHSIDETSERVCQVKSPTKVLFEPFLPQREIYHSLLLKNEHNLPSLIDFSKIHETDETTHFDMKPKRFVLTGNSHQVSLVQYKNPLSTSSEKTKEFAISVNSSDVIPISFQTHSQFPTLSIHMDENSCQLFQSSPMEFELKGSLDCQSVVSFELENTSRFHYNFWFESDECRSDVCIWPHPISGFLSPKERSRINLLFQPRKSVIPAMKWILHIEGWGSWSQNLLSTSSSEFHYEVPLRFSGIATLSVNSV